MRRRRTARRLLAGAAAACPLAALLLTAASCARPEPDVSGLAELLLADQATKAPFPLFSVAHPSLDADRAYTIQQAFVLRRLRADRLAGFKAALTSPAARARLSAREPVAGVLFESGRRSDGATLDGALLRQPVIETEIGLRFAKAISTPFESAEELRAAVGAVLPVIELPETGFRDMEQVTAVDLIAVNAGSAWYVVGEGQVTPELDLDSIVVTLARDGQELGQGRATETMGGPWQAALWLANRVLEQGYSIEPGHILLTGALGRPLPATPGHYAADYGRLGRLTFQIR